MKITRVTPKPVRQDVVITLSYDEARCLKTIVSMSNVDFIGEKWLKDTNTEALKKVKIEFLREISYVQIMDTSVVER